MLQSLATSKKIAEAERNVHQEEISLLNHAAMAMMTKAQTPEDFNLMGVINGRKLSASKTIVELEETIARLDRDIMAHQSTPARKKSSSLAVIRAIIEAETDCRVVFQLTYRA